MREVTKTTKAGEVEYPVTFQVFETFEELLERSRGGEDQILQIVNAAQEQGAKQGGKEEVRKAIREYGADSDEVAEAVGKHQERAAQYVIGAPRGSAGREITKTKAREFGAALWESLSDEEIAALAEEKGIEL